MKLRKVTTIEATTTDGRVMEVGRKYVFVLGGRSLCGIYRGIAEKRGALSFEVPIKDEGIIFNIMPGGVESIYEAQIRVMGNEAHIGDIGSGLGIDD